MTRLDALTALLEKVEAQRPTAEAMRTALDKDIRRALPYAGIRVWELKALIAMEGEG